MALIVNHNIPAIQSYNAVNYTSNLLEKSIQKLSTGLRINSAADDAAGLAISEKMRAQVRGLDRAVMNSQDGISMIQTAEGALNETHSILQRMRELSVQAANDTLTQQDRAYIQLEVDQLREEVTRIGNTTQFNKKKLLDGSAAVIWSSNDLGTKAVISGGLRTVDQFGQKNIKEANYEIKVTGSGGMGELLKSNVFKVKHNTTTPARNVGDMALSSNKLRDIEQFWNSEGRFILDDPKTITITQGNGKQAQFTIYGDNTLDEVVKKLNVAIGDPVTAGGLGQDKFNAGSQNYATYINSSSTQAGMYNFGGVIYVHSIVPGADGRLSFSGDEDVLRALGLSTVREAKEATYSVEISNAHGTGNFTVPISPAVENGTVTGNRLIGMVHANVDVIFDALLGGQATIAADGTLNIAWNQKSTYLHLKDNTTVFQIGANEGEDMSINIGDMRSEALALNKVLVTNRTAAARSITVIDNAIDKVSSQRARLGAYQNRLEHTINNLTIASQNLTASESRIRDTDMAKEMMNFTKLQILLQAGTSMLAQSNGLPQNVLTLLR